MRKVMRFAGPLAMAVLLSAAGVVAPDSPVADAAQRRDAAAVKALLGGGADVDAAQGDGMTALHWAAYHGDSALAAVLIGARAKVRVVTRIGEYTPLHVASEMGYAAVVTVLLAAGADAEAITTTGVTPLHLAAMAGSVPAVRALLERGAQIDVKEPAWGQTPLMLAAAKGRTATVQLLLARGADHSVTAKVVNLSELAALDRQARQLRNQALSAARREQGADSIPGWRPSSEQVQQAVRTALEVERRRADEKLLAAHDSAEAVAVAVQTSTGGGGGDEDAAGFTAAVGTQGGLTALLLAVREGHAETVRALLDGGADIDLPTPGDRTTPILLAAINGHYDLVKYLLDRGADPNLASDAGATPLYAVINKEWAPTSRTPQPAYHLQQEISYLELMEALLKAKADPNVQLRRSLWYTTYNRDNLRVDFRGATPFWRAAYATDIPAMKLLLAHGADPNIPTVRAAPRPRAGAAPAAPPADGGYGAGAVATDPPGAVTPPSADPTPNVWPIIAAAGVGYGQGYAANDHRHAPDAWLPAVRFLVEELGADVNAKDANGHTPLHFAAARGDNEMILYLVSKGADVTAVARNGQTTVDMANGPVQRISPFLETVALLEKLGAKNNHRCVGC